jgi:hypothetical protein
MNTRAQQNQANRSVALAESDPKQGCWPVELREDQLVLLGEEDPPWRTVIYDRSSARAVHRGVLPITTQRLRIWSTDPEHHLLHVRTFIEHDVQPGRGQALASKGDHLPALEALLLWLRDERAKQPPPRFVLLVSTIDRLGHRQKNHWPQGSLESEHGTHIDIVLETLFDMGVHIVTRDPDINAGGAGPFDTRPRQRYDGFRSHISPSEPGLGRRNRGKSPSVHQKLETRRAAVVVVAAASAASDAVPSSSTMCGKSACAFSFPCLSFSSGVVTRMRTCLNASIRAMVGHLSGAISHS